MNDFREHEKAYLAPTYQESQVRQDFIDKYFTALGWDVSHQRQKNPYEQEVKIENKVSTQGSQRRADYAFFIAPNFRDVKFYAEAKKPTKNLKDAAFYHQTIRYGWNSGTPIAILTDFEEFHILDCRYKPDIEDALNRKLEYFHYSEYADEEKFKKIFYLFGREAVAGGSLEKYAADLPKPRGKAKQHGLFPARRGFGGKGAYQPVDEAFLEELDSYRETLAKAFKKENSNLGSEELTEAVQRTIDRLVFIRFLEDKQIEDPQMINYREKSSAWKKFSAHCRSLEPKYNGLVFKKHRILDDTGFVPPDDNTFANICDELTDPSSPYDFDKIPISILGSIYERFLGKVVHATAKQVRVEPKPEVRKAGGVYYTPQYIVGYIVSETVGKLLYEEQGIGVRGEGIGVQGLEIMKGENDGVTNVQGTGSVEAGDIVGGRNLQADDASSQGGTIRIEEPNATGGGFNSGEHSGGIRTGESEGIPSVPVVRTGIVNGIGNTFGNSDTGYPTETGTNSTGNILDGRSRENAHPSHPISQSSLNPNAYTPNPNAYTLIPKLTPKQVEDLKIIDIACGSGSFLIEVYSVLLEYHERYYAAHPEAAKKGDLSTRDGKQVLSLKKRQEILVNNIYGVDIDFQATEVTQLSLYLKLLEDATLNDAVQFSLLKEKLLPDLKNNIICGNSLIGTDINTGELFENKETQNLKPMNFEDAFPEIMRGGGFDVVVGNPPYVRQELLSDLKSYFEKRYKVYQGAADLFSYFIEKGITLLRPGGLFSYIVANKWMRSNYGEPLRQWLKDQGIIQLIDFGDLPVFQGVSTYPCIIVVNKNSQQEYINVTKIDSLENLDLPMSVSSSSFKVSIQQLKSEGWTLSDEASSSLLDKIKSSGSPLGEYVKGKIFYGVKTGLNEAFVIDEEIKNKLISEDPKCKELIKPFLAGRDIKRYGSPRAERYLIFTRRGIDIKKYPSIEKYLSGFKESLMPKPSTFKGSVWKGRKPGSYKWYEIQDTVDYYLEFEKPKIIVPAIVQNASYAYDAKSIYSNDKTSIIPTTNLYLLGLLNSKVCDFVMHRISSTKQGGYYEYKPMYLEQLPIHTIDFTNETEKARHAHIVNLVEQMLKVKEELASAKLDSDVQRLELRCATLDRQIDEAVYELYGLTEEEIRIVEGK